PYPVGRRARGRTQGDDALERDGPTARDRTGPRPTECRGRPGDDGRRRDRLDRSGPPPPAETFRTGARRRGRGAPRIQGKPKPLRRGFIFRCRGGTVRFLRKGKVKEVYEVSPRELEFFFTDQISVFDKVIPTQVPHK